MALTMTDVTPRQALSCFEEKLGLSVFDIATALDVSTRTLTRWKRGEAYPQHNARARMSELLALADSLESIFEASPASREWMQAESQYLGGLTPTEAVRAGRIDRARAALEALESGIYL